jgi:hypothetical protein
MKIFLLAVLLLRCPVAAFAMRRLVAATVAIAVIVSAAWVEAGVDIGDANGRLIGRVIGFADATRPDDTAIVVADIEGLFVRLYVARTHFYADGEVVFTTSDCSGKAWTTAAPPTSGWLHAYALYAGWLYSAAEGSQGRFLTVRSVGGLNGRCHQPFPFGMATVYPAQRVVRMPSSSWTPPFQMRFR